MVKAEIKAFVNRVEQRQYDIALNPDLVDEEMEISIETDPLTNAEVFELMLFLDQLDSLISECVIEEHHGEYVDVDGSASRMHLAKKVSHNTLAKSFGYENGGIRISACFWYDYTSYDGSYDQYEITSEAFKEYLKNFIEMPEEKFYGYEDVFAELDALGLS